MGSFVIPAKAEIRKGSHDHSYGVRNARARSDPHQSQRLEIEGNRAMNTKPFRAVGCFLAATTNSAYAIGKNGCARIQNGSKALA